MEVLLIPLALVIGIIAAMIGIGGGALIVPLLMFTGIEAHSAIGIGVGAVALTSFSALFEYLKQKSVDLKLTLFMGAFSIPGAILGSWLCEMTPSGTLQHLFAILLFAMAFIVWNRKALEGKIPRGSLEMERKLETDDGKLYTYKAPLMLLAPVSFAAGVLAGFFGIGGGILKVPAMILSGIPTRIAIATSTSLVSLNSATAVASHGVIGSDIAIYLLFLGPVLVMGAIIGARLSKDMEAEHFRRIFSFVILVFAIMLWFKS